MRAPVASFVCQLALALAGVALSVAWAVAPAVAGEPTADSLVVAAAVSDGEADDGADPAEVPVLAGTLAGGALRVSADVALVAAADGDAVEPVVGSFTVGGVTYAVVGEGQVALVAVSPKTLADGLAGGSAAGLADAPDGGSSGALSDEGIDSGVPPRSEAEQAPSGATSPQPSPEGASSDGFEAEGASEPVALEVPESVEHDGIAYSVTSIGPRALAGCDADVVTIPVTVESVDELALRGSAVKAIEVADGSPHFSSYDGMLFDADQLSLLLIPEGKQGAARIPKTASTVPPSAFSHCAGVTSIEVEAGSAAFSSRNGCLYDAMTNTLLWAPCKRIDRDVITSDGDAVVDGLMLEEVFFSDGPIVHVESNEGFLIKTDLTTGAQETLATSYEQAEGNWTLLGGTLIQYGRATDHHLVRVEARRIGHKLLWWENFAAGVTVSGTHSQYFVPKWGALKQIILDGNQGALRIEDNTGAYKGTESSLTTGLTGTNWSIQTTGIFCATGEGVYGYGFTVTPYRTGYRFEGWKVLGSTETDPGRIAYPRGTYFSGSEDVRIACLWHKVHSIDVDGNGGELEICEASPNAQDTQALSYKGTSTGRGWSLDAAGVLTVHEDQRDTTYRTLRITPHRDHFYFQGWSIEPKGDAIAYPTGQPYSGNSEDPTIGSDVTLYARWVPVIAVDAPIGLDIEMDVLGVEAQRAGSGKLVSRSGAALEVEKVACEPVAEAAEALFGWGGQDEAAVSLTVAAEGAAAGLAVSFALGGPSEVGDPSALAPFALPDGYGSEVALAYGIAMPEGYAIPAAYPAQRTPIARLTYTVRLAGEAA